jgi:hypothetical protein
MLLATLFLAACSTTPEAPPPGAAFAEGLPSPQARACFEAACGAGDQPAADCFASRCPERAEAIALVPQKVRWDEEEGLFFFEAHVEYSAPAWGEHEQPREDPLFVGVTLITPEGEELDLAIATRFPGAFDEPFFISSEVDKPIQDLIAGVWDRKIEPCESERPGCQEFGFLLDGPQASWPPGFYERFEAQRLPPATLSVVGLSAGARVAEVQQRTDRVVEALGAALEPFGTQVIAGAPGLAPGAAEQSLVRCQHNHDKPLARIAAQALGGEPEGWSCCEHTPALPADRLELIVKGSEAHLACLGEHCAAVDDLAACEATSCP